MISHGAKSILLVLGVDESLNSPGTVSEDCFSMFYDGNVGVVISSDNNSL